MTNEQKLKIKQLRQSGYGYATIAEALGLTKNQVSAFCRRNTLSGTKAENNAKAKLNANCCRCCGKPLIQKPGRKPVKFCSDRCRVSWWNSHPGMVNKRAASITSPALAAGRISLLMAMQIENTALTPATSQTASKAVLSVNEEQFEREKLYQATMSMFRSMLKNGSITEEQYAIIDTKMQQKYQPLLGTLFAAHPLT